MAMMHNPASPGELLREFLGKTTATNLAPDRHRARHCLARSQWAHRHYCRPEYSSGAGARTFSRLLLESSAPIRFVVRVAEEAAKDQTVGSMKRDIIVIGLYTDCL